MIHAVIFDQDGTLMDSGLGIKHTAIETLKQKKLPYPPYEKMDYFIGPPLSDCFRLSGVSEERIPEAVKLYRIRYAQKGMFEEEVYPGILSLLFSIRQAGYQTYVATSKSKRLAEAILIHFRMRSLFDGVFGASEGVQGESKATIIASCLSTLPKESKVIMVGDTYLDILGAKENHIPAIGVTYGYGEKERMRENGCSLWAKDAEELEQLLLDLLIES